MKFYELGGFFDINSNRINNEKNNVFKNLTNKKYLYNGRQAILYALEDIENSNILKEKVALLPAYTCESVIKPFMYSGYKVVFYDSDKKLRIKISDINKAILENNISVLLLQPMFGFDNIIRDEDLIRTDIKIILDRTQNVYSEYNADLADYIIFSIRKWMEVLDGGVIEKLNGELIDKELLNIDIDTFNLAMKSQTKRYDYLIGGIGDKNEYLKLYKEYNLKLEVIDKIYHMTNASKNIMSEINVEELKNKRIINYNFLLNYSGWNKFGDVMFENISNEEVPLYFPVVIKSFDREEVLSFLYSKKIYAAKIWPQSELVPDSKISKESKFLYERLVAFPIDQRYSNRDMEYIVESLEEFLSTHK